MINVQDSTVEQNEEQFYLNEEKVDGCYVVTSGFFDPALPTLKVKIPVVSIVDAQRVVDSIKVKYDERIKVLERALRKKEAVLDAVEFAIAEEALNLWTYRHNGELRYILSDDDKSCLDEGSTLEAALAAAGLMEEEGK